METHQEKTDDPSDHYGCIEMIVDERMVTYIHSLETPENSLLEEIEKEALDTYVPIIRKETKSFLKTLITMNRPMNI